MRVDYFARPGLAKLWLAAFIAVRDFLTRTAVMFIYINNW